MKREENDFTNCSLNLQSKIKIRINHLKHLIATPDIHNNIQLRPVPSIVNVPSSIIT